MSKLLKGSQSVSYKHPAYFSPASVPLEKCYQKFPDLQGETPGSLLEPLGTESKIPFLDVKFLSAILPVIFKLRSSSFTHHCFLWIFTRVRHGGTGRPPTVCGSSKWQTQKGNFPTKPAGIALTCEYLWFFSGQMGTESAEQWPGLCSGSIV